MLQRLKTILTISRPRFWLYTAGPFLLGFVAYMPNLNSLASWQFVWLFLFFGLVSNIWLYGVNDWFDAETDQLNPKKTDQEHLLKLHERQFLNTTLLLCNFLMLGTLFILSPLAGLFLFIFWWLCWSYSAPPCRWKIRPFFDSYSNVLYIVPGLVAASLHIDFTSLSHLPRLLLIFACGWCWTAAMHAYSAIPDIAADQKAGLQTIATKLGLNKALWFCTINWLLFAAGISAVTKPWGVLAFIYPLVSFVLLSAAHKSAHPTQLITRWYWFFPWLNALLGGIAFWIITWVRFIA